MRKYLLASAAAIVLASGSALAADLPVRGPAAAPAPVFVAMNWTGFYVGAQIGGIHANDSASAHFLGVPIGGAAQSYNDTAAIGGLHIGYNWQFNSLVFGLEADANLSGLSKTATSLGPFLPVFPITDSVRVRSNFEGALVARAGVAFNNAMLYALGGASFANIDVRYTLPTLLGVVQSNDNTRFGWTVGAGLAYKFAPNWSGRVEYRYANYGSETHTLAATGVSVRHKIETHRVMFGLSYHFGGPAGAVVARY